MNLNDPQNWQALAAVIGAVALIIGALMRMQGTVLRGLEDNRAHSETGRARIYERMEEMAREFREGFVTRVEHAAEMRLMTHSQEEISRQQAELLRRVEQQCRYVRARRGDAVESFEEPHQ